MGRESRERSLQAGFERVRPRDIEEVWDAVAAKPRGELERHLVGIRVVKIGGAAHPPLVVQGDLEARIDRPGPLWPEVGVSIDERRPEQLAEDGVLDALANTGEHLQRREGSPSKGQRIATGRQLRAELRPVVGVVIDASSDRHMPVVGDGKLLLSEVRMIVDAEILKRIRLTVVGVSGTEDLVIEPGHVHLVLT